MEAAIGVTKQEPRNIQVLQETENGTAMYLQDEQGVFVTTEAVPPKPTTQPDKVNREGGMEEP